MKLIKFLIAAALILGTAPASAQTLDQGRVVSTCGSASYTTGTNAPITVDQVGNQCTGGGGSGSPTTVSPIYLTPTNDSLSLTLGGTAQAAIASNTTRKGCLVENPALAADQGISTAEFLYVNFGGTAAAASTSFALAPGQSISCSPLGIGTVTSAVSVVAATTAHKIIAVEFN